MWGNLFGRLTGTSPLTFTPSGQLSGPGLQAQPTIKKSQLARGALLAYDGVISTIKKRIVGKMDPITVTIVSALAAGAAAGATAVATSAIKDAYAGLRQVIIDRYQRAAPFVDAVAADPASEPEQKVLAKQLGQAGAANDEELKAAARALLDAIESLRSDARAAAMFDFDRLRAARNFELDIEGIGQVLRAREATFEGDFKAKVRQPAGGNGEKHRR